VVLVTATEEQHAAAIIAALTATSAAPYDLDDAKALTTIPNGYTEVMVSPRGGAPLRSPGSTGRRGWRIATRQVGTTVSNAREMRKRTHEALEFVRLTVGGDQTTPIQFDSAEQIGEDDGYWSGLETWTYVL
jgi:hypothetical protein